MTKKTPEQRIADLEERRKKVEARLKLEKEAIVRAKRREHAKILNQRRKEDTRRKILIGALRLDQLNKLSDEEAKKREKHRLKKEMDRFLTRNEDRKLFGLAPILDRNVGEA